MRSVQGTIQELRRGRQIGERRTEDDKRRLQTGQGPDMNSLKSQGSEFGLFSVSQCDQGIFLRNTGPLRGHEGLKKVP